MPCSEHVHGVIAAIAPTDSEARFRALGATVLRGEARFVAPDALVVDGRRLDARRIVIAAGSTAAVPPIPGLDRVPYLTNTTIFDLQRRPEHLLILGGGPIGLELADAFAGLGSRVTVLEAATIAGKEDPELVAGLRACLMARGIAVLEGASVAAIEPGPTAVLADGRRIAGSHLLVAVGRRPNLDALDLAAGNVRATPAGIATDRGLRSLTNRRVYAVGDIADPQGIGPRAFTHVGSYHAGIVIRRALFRLPARIDYAALPRVTYTRPELAQVGMTEAEARAAGHRVAILRWPLADNDRATAERRYRRTGQAGRRQGPRPRRRHPGAQRRRDDRALDTGDRAAGETRRSGVADRALPDPLGGGQARRRRLLRAATVRAAHQDAGPAAGTVAVTRRPTQLVAMRESDAGPPRVRPRQSLSGRLWLVATLAVLLSEIVVFLPYIAHERSQWLFGRVEDASIAVLAAADMTSDMARHNELLRLSGAEAIRLTGRDGAVYTVGDVAMPVDATIDVRQEDMLVGIRRALRAMLLPEDRLIHVLDYSPFRPHPEIEVWVHERGLSIKLQDFARDFAILSLLIAGVTGGLVYLAVLLLLVRPMRRITGSIAAFRADPERTTPLDPGRRHPARARRDLGRRTRTGRDAARAARRAVAQRPAGRSRHRGRQGQPRPARHPDPGAADRGAASAQRRSPRAARRRSPGAGGRSGRRSGAAHVGLCPRRPAAAGARTGRAGAAGERGGGDGARTGRRLRLNNAVDPAILVRADRIHMFRVLTNLLRNAAEAGARSIRVTARHNSPTLAIEIADDGPGLPEPVRADLFRPFAGSARRGGTGLGLAIARDLMVAHGGDIELVDTGADGTTFRLTLRIAEAEQPPNRRRTEHALLPPRRPTYRARAQRYRREGTCR